MEIIKDCASPIYCTKMRPCVSG